MKAFLLISLSHVVSASHWSDDEACLFVGARFARTSSSCEHGLCTGFAETMEGKFSTIAANGAPVICAKAAQTVQIFLSETTEPVRSAKRMRRDSGDAPELTRMLNDGVIPWFRRLGFGAEVALPAFDQALAAFELRARFLAAENPAQWHEATVPAVLSSAELVALGSLTIDIVQGQVNRSLMSASLRLSQRSALHFYFDIAALLGRHFLKLPVLPLATMLLRYSVPRFRAVDRREESRTLDWQGVPRDAPTTLFVARAVDQLGAFQVASTLEDIAAIIKLLIGWQLNPPTAAKALLGELMETSVCTNLSVVAGKLTSLPQFSHSIHTLAVSLLDFCRPHTPMAARRVYRDFVSQRFALGEPSYPDPAKVAAVDFLRNEATVWYAGFDASVSEMERRSISQRILREFTVARVTWAWSGVHLVPRFADQSGIDHLAFGRALGLAILHGANLELLRIHRAVVELLHPRFRVTASDLHVVESQIAPATTDDVLNISSGLDDILGHGGFEMFTDKEWLRLFGH